VFRGLEFDPGERGRKRGNLGGLPKEAETIHKRTGGKECYILPVEFSAEWDPVEKGGVMGM